MNNGMNIHHVSTKPGADWMTRLSGNARICRGCTFYCPVDSRYGHCGGLCSPCASGKTIQQMVVHGDGRGCSRHAVYHIKYSDEI